MHFLPLLTLLLAATVLASAGDKKVEVIKASPAFPALPRDEGELLMTTVLYRHGQRNPYALYPKDPWGAEEYWPGGLGQLTNHGKLQHFELGKWLRRRYLGSASLKSDYDSRDFYIRSTDVDRTLASATANLHTLYPATIRGPNGLKVHNPRWIPIPIHTVPLELDDTLYSDRKCPEYDRLYEEFKRDYVKPLFGRVPNLVRYVERHSGLKVEEDVFKLTMLADIFLIEQQRNLTLPAWTDRLMLDEEGAFWRLANLAWTIETDTAQLARLKYGRLLAEILQRFAEKSDGKLDPDRGMWVYSGHDSTITGLLNTMGLWKTGGGRWPGPPYASAVLFELRLVGDEPAVKVLFRRGWDTESLRNDNEAVALVLPGCEELCPLWRMKELLVEVLPTGSFEEECGLVG